MEVPLPHAAFDEVLASAAAELGDALRVLTFTALDASRHAARARHHHHRHSHQPWLSLSLSLVPDARSPRPARAGSASSPSRCARKPASISSRPLVSSVICRRHAEPKGAGEACACACACGGKGVPRTLAGVVPGTGASASGVPGGAEAHALLCVELPAGELPELLGDGEGPPDGRGAARAHRVLIVGVRPRLGPRCLSLDGPRPHRRDAVTLKLCIVTLGMDWLPNRGGGVS